MKQTAQILVVDDEPVLLKINAQLLRSAGYEVLEATTGEEGLRLARQQQPDLVLLDVMLPGINGLEVCHRIKADPALADTFVTLLSGKQISSDKQAEGLENGADDYLVRPIAKREFLARIKAMVRLQQAEKNLRRAQAEMEQRVIERTTELEQANRALQAEIAERKQVEAALRESKQQYQAIFENSRDAILLTTPDGGIVSANPAACRIFGRTEAELKQVGRPGIVDAGDPRVTAALKKRARTDGFSGELTLVRGDGSKFPGEATSAIFNHQSGQTMTVTIVRDITARKETEQTLAESEERFRSYFELGLVGMAIETPTGDWIAVNDQLCEMFGYTRSELMRQHWQDLTHPDDLDKDLELFNQLVQNKIGHYMLEKRFIHKNGQIRHWIISLTCSRRANGEAEKVFAYAIDITDRKQAEQDLRESEMRFRQLAENIKVAFWVGTPGLGEERQVLYVSPAFETIFGIKPEAVYESGARWVEVIHPEDRERVVVALDNFLRGYAEYDEEYRILHPEGGVRWIQARSFALKDKQGQIYRTVGLAQDITARKQAEAKIKASEERFKAIFEEAPIAVLFYDTGGKLREANPAALELSGVARLEEILGVSLFDNPNIPPEHQIKLQQGESIKFQSTIDFDNIRRMGFYQPHKTGVIYVDWVITPVSQRGFLVQIQDETQRRQAEQALRESEELHRVTLENILDPIFLTDEAGNFTFICPNVIHALGYTVEEIQAMGTIAQLVGDDLFDPAELEKRGEIQNIERTVVGKDGQERVFLFGVRRVSIKQGAMLYTGHNVTERKKAQDELQQRNRELALFNRTLQAFSSTLELDQVLVIVLEQVRDLLEVVACSVWLLDPAANELTCRQVTGPAADVARGWRLPLSEGLVGWVARTGQSLVVPDAQADERHFKGVDEKTGLDIRSLLSVPLRAKDKVRGVLQVVDETANKFDPTDLTLLESVAASAAIAIENAQLFDQVQQANTRFQAVSRRLLEVQEAERRHIARELHDEVGQILTGLNLLLELSARAAGDEIASQLDEARQLVEELIGKIDELSLDLRPAMLDDLGLLPALVWLVERYAGYMEMDVRLEHNGIDQRFSPELETAAFRVAQEALTNVARHAQVSTAVVRFRAGQNTLRLQVQDEGVGFDVHEKMVSLETSGLSGMRERAALLGGQLTIESIPGKGTRVSAIWLLPQPVGEETR